MSLTGAADIARMSWGNGSAAHCRFPAWEATDGARAAATGSIAIGYNGQTGVVLRTEGGRTMIRDLPRGSIRLNGPEPLYWLRTSALSEVLEITASPEQRRLIADELGISTDADLADVHGWEDSQAWAILSRFRMAVRGAWPLTDLERDHLLRHLYIRAFRAHFGGRQPDTRAGERGLNAGRLRRVADYVEAHLHEPLTIAALASVAAFSTFHFARSFKRATGLAPYQFVSLRRIERARALLLGTTQSVEAISFAVGFSNRAHFRRIFKAELGVLPSAFRAK